MSVHAHWVYLGALFSALVQSTLGLTMIARVAWNISKDPHGLKCGVTIYRLVVLMSAIFIFVRATPTALVIMFDPPYPLTKSLETQYIAVMFGLPIAATFACIVEVAKKPLERMLKESGVEFKAPILPEIRRELLIIGCCLVLAFLIVMSRG
jgi:hypothetical protein